MEFQTLMIARAAEIIEAQNSDYEYSEKLIDDLINQIPIMRMKIEEEFSRMLGVNKLSSRGLTRKFYGFLLKKSRRS